MKKTFLVTVVATLLLSGCQQHVKTHVSQAPVDPAADTANANRIALVRAQQYSLWDEGVVNTRSPLPADTIYANSSRVSLDWDGDAVELLAQLARQRGLSFNYSGVRLPLPLNIHVRDMTFQNLLRIVVSQTQWRATLEQNPGQLQLNFMPIPKPDTHRRARP
ncbi:MULTISPECIES: DotD/TraH family lipoprotein [Rosenbergiella]|uniref:DotD/TraH family lipoprotein n=1 Tax=Rosenbergiella TaxID=1356488 RepID=UPI001F4F66E9|nr:MULTISPECIES: DotD/TraH family lipoprotein [Rosenbergiella]